MGALQHLELVGGEPQRLAHARVGELRSVDLHARHRGGGGHRLVDVDVGDRAEMLQGVDLAVVDAVHLARVECRGFDGRVVAEVDEIQLVEERAVVPPAIAAPEHGALVDGIVDELERAGAVRADAERAALLRIEDGEGIVEQMLRHRDLRLLQIEAHGAIVDHLNGVGVPQLGGGLGTAVRIDVADLDLVQHVAFHEADDGGAGLRIEHALQVPRSVLGGERAAGAPARLAHEEGPGLEVVARLPALEQVGACDVVLAGLGQILVYAAADVGIVDPGVVVRVLDRRTAHGDAQGAAAGQLGRAGGRCERLAGDATGPHVGGAGGHAEKRRIAQEGTSGDRALSELLLEFGDPEMFAIRHGPQLPAPPLLVACANSVWRRCPSNVADRAHPSCGSSPSRQATLSLAGRAFVAVGSARKFRWGQQPATSRHHRPIRERLGHGRQATTHELDRRGA